MQHIAKEKKQDPIIHNAITLALEDENKLTERLLKSLKIKFDLLEENNEKII